MKRIGLAFAGMTLLLFLLIFININMGSVSMSVGDVLAILMRRAGDEMALNIIWEIRMPRILAAVLLGGALSVSGFLLQTFFANPIAGPYILGISSGAKLTVALTMITMRGRGKVMRSWQMIAAAFVGAMLAMGFVLLISYRVKKMALLVVCGVMVGYICSAITDFAVTFAEDSNIVNLHNWSQGSFSGISWGNMPLITGFTVAASGAAFLLSKPIGAFLLGENYARNMGVNVRALRVLLILLSSLLSACVTAFAGPISFVGIAVPHLVKSLMKTSRPLLMIPGCFLGGGAVTLFCDGVARTLFAPTELSISSVTAALLVPVVIAMMLKK